MLRARVLNGGLSGALRGVRVMVRRHACALAAALLAAVACLAGGQEAAAVANASDATGAAAAQAVSPAERWASWLAGEAVAHRYARTRAELERFGHDCAFMAPAWASLADAHESLARVIVVDVRHNWTGLGDSHERWNFLLRVARATGRAAFLWADDCADAEGPKRSVAPGVPAHVRPPGCQFDPGAYVSGFGGVDWRWDAAKRRRVQAAQGPGAAEVAVQFQCLREISRGCGHAVVRWAANATVALSVEGAEAEDTAGPVQAFLTDALATHPWLRLETTVQGDLTREAFSARSCRWVGHPDRPECGQSCESVANWRPRPRTWAVLRPTLLRLDAWAAVASVTVRTGAADHFGAQPETLTAGDAGGAPNASAAQLDAIERLMQACTPDAPNFRRDKMPNETPCVNWRSDDPSAEAPNATLFRGCSGMIDIFGASNATTEALLTVSDGPLGTYIGCAARGAAALAAAEDRSPDSWGVMLFSDAPALKCALEASALAAAGHAAVTPSHPGHTQYAPAGALLRNAGMSAITEWYVLGLTDISLHTFSSAFGGSANVRGFRPRRVPPGAMHVPLHRGFERWFEAGRENHGPVRVDAATLTILAATHDGCPVQQQSVREAARHYAEIKAAKAAAAGG